MINFMSKIKFFSSFQGLCLVRVLAFISVLIGLILGLNHSLVIYARTINAGVLRIECPGDGALFSASNITPGYEETKIVRVTNTGVVPHSFSIAVSGTLDSLAKILEIEPKINGVPQWTKTLNEIAQFPESTVIINSIAPGNSVEIEFLARLPQAVDNFYQGKTTGVFDFIMGNESTDQPEPPPPAIGGLPSAPALPGPLAVSSLAMGVGPSFVSATPLSTPEKVGAQEGEQKGVAEEGETKGVVQKLTCWWWLVFSILLAVFLVAFGYVVYSQRVRARQPVLILWFWPFAAAIILYVIHLIIHRYFEPSKMCQFFFWIELVELVIYFGTIYFLARLGRDKGSAL